MRIIHYFTGTDKIAAARRAILSAVLLIAITAGVFLLGTVTRASATEQQEAPSVLNTQLSEALSENALLVQETEYLRKALDAAQAESNALTAQAAAAAAEAGQLRAELEALRQEHSKSYVLRFRVERNITFPESSEILYFTRTVDEQTYNRWQQGAVLQESPGFLSIPNDGMLHEWVIILDDKYVTANEG